MLVWQSYRTMSIHENSKDRKLELKINFFFITSKLKLLKMIATGNLRSVWMSTQGNGYKAQMYMPCRNNVVWMEVLAGPIKTWTELRKAWIQETEIKVSPCEIPYTQNSLWYKLWTVTCANIERETWITIS